ncbi:MAG: TlpA family protein disulfide reductase [Muribaculaceae bacterium]|nr:TlpA family protein disulfide reductase [Muribaculaceae bacterium]
MSFKVISMLIGTSMLFVPMQLSGQTVKEKDIMSVTTIAGELPNHTITCEITGTVIDRPETTSALIVEAGKDFRIHPSIKVPVVDGKFSYTLHDSIPMAYDVIFDDELKRGTWRIRNFFSGNGNVKLFYHNREKADDDRVISDIRDNTLAEKFTKMKNDEFQEEKNRLYALIHTLYENKTVYPKDIQDLYDKLESLPQGHERDSIMDLVGRRFKEACENSYAHSKFYSKEYLEYEKELTDIYIKSDLMKRNFISENPSLYGLYSIKEALMRGGDVSDGIDIPAYEDIFETIYKGRFPGHPYTEEISGLIEARNVKAGNKYPDFKVTREDGTTEQMSSLIKGNVAVIDLWASWCGPCRRHSIDLIPVYEKYKDKGFKVIAVARESDNCIAMNKAMEKDGYPWESFVDLNDQDNVWRINRAGNSGGKIILVNSDGVIVDTDMPIKEIEEFLDKTYGSMINDK